MENRDEINLLELLIVILRRKRLIIGITILSTLITVIISLIMTPIYRGETKIMPPQSSGNGLGAQLLSQVGDVGSLAGNLINVNNTPNALYVDLLKSRTILDNIIDEFDLMKLYNVEYPEDARKELGDNLDVTEEKKSGIISIAVEDEDPRRASDMANAFVQELKKLTKGLAISEAAQRRLFFEEQMADSKKTLLEVEDDMKRFQETTGALQIEEQAKAIIEGIAELRAQIAAKEVEIRAMKAFLTDNNPELKLAEEELNGMKIELKKLEIKKDRRHDPLMPSGILPEVGTEYLRKLRELKYAETLYELLVQQYEIAKLDESKDHLSIQIIDKAVPPQKRARPKRRIMVIGSALVGLFFAFFLVLFLEFIEKMKSDPEKAGKLELIKKSLKLRKS